MRPWAPPASHVTARPLIPAPPALAAILALALLLRLIAARTAEIGYPDELFQYLEQAHRLVWGGGVVPWEYRLGIRGGLLPVLLVGPAWVAREAGWPAVPLWRGLLAIVALAPVAAGWLIGRRRSHDHALIAAFALAIWPELVWFAPHALAEPVAVALLLLGGALVGERHGWRIALGGALLGLGGLVRFQYLPAAALLALPALILPASRRPILCGLLAAFLASLLADIAIGQAPFAWIAENVRLNALEGRAARYGIAGPLAYPRAIGGAWGGWTVPIVLLAAGGARRAPPLAVAAAATLALHMMVGHKEYRFILLATSLTILLAALGSADILRTIAERRPALAKTITPAAIALWSLVALTIAASGRMATLGPPQPAERTLFATLRGDAAACGVALWGRHWSASGGQALLDRDVPLYLYAADEAPSAAANRLIGPRGGRLDGFVARRCIGAICLYARPGGCRGDDAAHAINPLLAARGE